MNQVEHQERVTDKGDNFLTLDLAFTDEQVKTSVSDSKDERRGARADHQDRADRRSSLGRPLVLGTVLMLRGRNEREEQDERVPEPVG